ncbi:hypothetical protein H4R19_005619, partial [Coemansia spiralis]
GRTNGKLDTDRAEQADNDDQVAWDFDTVRHALPPKLPAPVPAPRPPVHAPTPVGAAPSSSSLSSSMGSSNMSALPAPPLIGGGAGAGSGGPGGRSRSGSTASNASGGLGLNSGGGGSRVPSGYGSNIPPPSPSMQARHVNNSSPVSVPGRSNLGPSYGASTPPPPPPAIGSGSRPSSAHKSTGSPAAASRLQQQQSKSNLGQPQRAAGGRQSTPEDLYHNVLMPTLVRLERLTSNTQAKAAYCTLAETIRRLEHEIPGIADVFAKELTLSVNKFYQTWRE